MLQPVPAMYINVIIDEDENKKHPTIKNGFKETQQDFCTRNTKKVKIAGLAIQNREGEKDLQTTVHLKHTINEENKLKCVIS